MQPQTCNISIILDDLKDVGKNLTSNFHYDDELLRVYSILAMYFFQDPRFEEVSPNFKLNKGILLRGNVGVGKTICLKVFTDFLRRIKHPEHFIFHLTNDVVQDYMIGGEEKLLNHGLHSFRRSSSEVIDFNRPLTRCYDDLGMENKVIKYYGNERNLMADILFKRYDLFISKGLKTIVSTNLKPEDIEEQYGYRIRSRMREMLNDIVIEGHDRRTQVILK